MPARGTLPIGVFDSGIGGLTVVRALRAALPQEACVYLGDTARVPYGTKSAEVVTRYALNNARLLTATGIKLLVVACNTASAVALDALARELDVPVVGVIGPGAARAAATTRSAVVGVIGTEGTVGSGAYVRALEAERPDLTVHSRPCPLFVPLAEEGWEEHPVAMEVARSYLDRWAGGAMDTLILGCTHYPLLRKAIQAAVGPGVTLVDSASAVAQTVSGLLAREGLVHPEGTRPPPHRFFATDVPERFREVGRRFLGAALDRVELVDIDPGR